MQDAIELLLETLTQSLLFLLRLLCLLLKLLCLLLCLLCLLFGGKSITLGLLLCG